jgi:pimeloyl-ACP methyl ester carboxylesterase
VTSYRYIDVDGLNVFVREAGARSAPAIVLLHGYPASSHMFRDLIPLLTDRFRVIAPDMIGFGHSDAPAAARFDYTFDTLAEVTRLALEQLEVGTCILYMHDYGGPIGLRLATAQPERVRGLVVQNANAYMEGLSDAVAGVFQPLWKERNRTTEAPARELLSAPMTQMQYRTGARNPDRLNPDAWTLDQALLDRPGISEIQLALFANYQTNVARYDAWHSYFRRSQPRTLVLWGKGDPLFTVAGAEAYKRDLREIEIVYLDGGHFALEEHATEVAARIKGFFTSATAAA